MTEKTLDALFSKLVRALHPLCQRCGAPSEDCAHIFTRSRRSTRWDTDNALAFCRRCHMWAHLYPNVFMEFVRTVLGKSKYDEVRARSLEVSKDRDLDAIAAELRARLKEAA